MGPTWLRAIVFDGGKSGIKPVPFRFKRPDNQRRPRLSSGLQAQIRDYPAFHSPHQRGAQALGSASGASRENPGLAWRGRNAVVTPRGHGCIPSWPWFLLGGAADLGACQGRGPLLAGVVLVAGPGARRAGAGRSRGAKSGPTADRSAGAAHGVQCGLIAFVGLASPHLVPAVGGGRMVAADCWCADGCKGRTTAIGH